MSCLNWTEVAHYKQEENWSTTAESSSHIHEEGWILRDAAAWRWMNEW